MIRGGADQGTSCGWEDEEEKRTSTREKNWSRKVVRARCEERVSEKGQGGRKTAVERVVRARASVMRVRQACEWREWLTG